MRTVDILRKKRDGGQLDEREIRFLIEGYTRGEIPDYQMSAWAMAVYFNGMSPEETAHLTMAMADSGDRIDLSAIQGVKVDKHSTGGVGDTTTLVLAPLVAAAGVPVAKMSGRGLGHTGGTIDKLEAIEGFRVELDREAFIRQVNDCGAAVMSQTGNITPADKLLYGLRDVTATVDSIPLIASSVMSKKIASGADAIVLDVKTGAGAFMKTVEEAIRLARAMVEIGQRVGRETVAVISGMDQPLGFAVGNALEVKEAIETLRGEGPADLRELCLALGAHMLVLGRKAEDYGQARAILQQRLEDGTALERLRRLIEAQGGRGEVVDRPEELLPAAPIRSAVTADRDGWVSAIEAERIGIAAMTLGAGRETKESRIDLAAGVVLRKKVGDPVKAGETLAELHVGEAWAARLDAAARIVKDAYAISGRREAPPPLLYAVVTGRGVERLP